MTGADRLSEAEREALGWVVFDGAPSRDELLASLEAAVESIIAARTSDLRAENERLRGEVDELRENRDYWRGQATRLGVDKDVAEVELHEARAALAGERERIAQAIEAAGEFEGERAQRVIRMCAHIAREVTR